MRWEGWEHAMLAAGDKLAAPPAHVRFRIERVG
jgi:hypothetical protein